MANIKWIRAKKNSVPEYEDGQFIFTDEGDAFVDFPNETRVRVGGLTNTSISEYNTIINNYVTNKSFYDANSFAASSDNHFLKLEIEYKTETSFQRYRQHEEDLSSDEPYISYNNLPVLETVDKETYTTDYIKCPQKLCVDFGHADARAYIYFYTKDSATGEYRIYWNQNDQAQREALWRPASWPNKWDENDQPDFDNSTPPVVNYFGDGRLKEHIFDFDQLGLQDDLYMTITIATQGEENLSLEQAKDAIQFFVWDGEPFGIELYSNPMFVTELGNVAAFNINGAFSVVIPGQAKHFVTQPNVAFWSVIGVTGSDEGGWQYELLNTQYKRRYMLLPEENEEGKEYQFFIARVFFLDNKTKDAIKETRIGNISQYCSAWLPTKITNQVTTLDAKRVLEACYKVNGLSWTPTRDLLAKGYQGIRVPRTYKTGVKYNGMPYGSNWKDARFIGWHVSPYTFINAVNDRHSIFYTQKVENEAPWYGNVCSSFATLVSGWPYPQTTAGFLYDPKVQKHFSSTPKMGAIFSGPGHCVIPEYTEQIDKDTFAMVAHEGVTPICASTKRYNNYFTSTEDAWTFSRGAEYYNNYGYIVHHSEETPGLRQLGTAPLSSYNDFDNITINPSRLKPYKGDRSVYTNQTTQTITDDYGVQSSGSVMINLADDITLEQANNLVIKIAPLSYIEDDKFEFFTNNIAPIEYCYYKKVDVVYDGVQKNYILTGETFSTEDPGGVSTKHYIIQEDTVIEIFKTETSPAKYYYIQKEKRAATRYEIIGEELTYFKENPGVYHVYSNLDDYAEPFWSFVSNGNMSNILIKLPKKMVSKTDGTEVGEPITVRATGFKIKKEIAQVGTPSELIGKDIIHQLTSTATYKVNKQNLDFFVSGVMTPELWQDKTTLDDNSYIRNIKTENQTQDSGLDVYEYTIYTDNTEEEIIDSFYYCYISDTRLFFFLNSNESTTAENAVLTSGLYKIWCEGDENNASASFEYICIDEPIVCTYKIAAPLSEGEDEITKLQNNAIPRYSVSFSDNDFWYAQMWCEGDVRYDNISKSVAVPADEHNNYSDWFQNGKYIRNTYAIFKQGRYGAYTVPFEERWEITFEDDPAVTVAIARDLIPFYIENDLYVLPRTVGNPYAGGASWPTLTNTPGFQRFNYNFELIDDGGAAPAVQAQHKTTGQLYYVIDKDGNIARPSSYISQKSRYTLQPITT